MNTLKGPNNAQPQAEQRRSRTSYDDRHSNELSGMLKREKDDLMGGGGVGEGEGGRGRGEGWLRKEKQERERDKEDYVW